MKRLFLSVISVLLCLSLASCGDIYFDFPEDVEGDDWRVTGIVRDGGTIVRNGESTEVLVCVNTKYSNFYLDNEYQDLYDSVEFPFVLEGDPWEEFQGIDFSDLNGDGNSDVTVKLIYDSQDVVMVWLFDSEVPGFVFYSEQSQLPTSVENTETNADTVAE